MNILKMKSTASNNCSREKFLESNCTDKFVNLTSFLVVVILSCVIAFYLVDEPFKDKQLVVMIAYLILSAFAVLAGVMGTIEYLGKVIILFMVEYFLWFVAILAIGIYGTLVYEIFINFGFELVAVGVAWLVWSRITEDK